MSKEPYWSKDMPKIHFDDLDFRVVIRKIDGKTTQANAKRMDEMTDRIFKIGDYVGDKGDIYAPSHAKPPQKAQKITPPSPGLRLRKP